MDEASKNGFVYKPFLLSSDFSVSRLFPLPDASQAYGWQGQGFRAEYTPQEEDSARSGFAAWPYLCHQTMHYLCIRASETSAWKDDLNYTIGGLFYLYADNNIKILNFEIYIV